MTSKHNKSSMARILLEYSRREMFIVNKSITEHV